MEISKNEMDLGIQAYKLIQKLEKPAFEVAGKTFTYGDVIEGITFAIPVGGLVGGVGIKVGRYAFTKATEHFAKNEAMKIAEKSAMNLTEKEVKEQLEKEGVKKLLKSDKEFLKNESKKIVQDIEKNPSKYTKELEEFRADNLRTAFSKNILEKDNALLKKAFSKDLSHSKEIKHLSNFKTEFSNLEKFTEEEQKQLAKHFFSKKQLNTLSKEEDELFSALQKNPNLKEEFNTLEKQLAFELSEESVKFAVKKSGGELLKTVKDEEMYYWDNVKKGIFENVAFGLKAVSNGVESMLITLLTPLTNFQHFSTPNQTEKIKKTNYQPTYQNQRPTRKNFFSELLNLKKKV